MSSEDPSCRFPNVLPGTRHRAGGRWGHSASLQLLHIVPCPYHSYHLTHTILTLRQIDNVWDARLHVFVDGWFKLYANQTDHQSVNFMQHKQASQVQLEIPFTNKVTIDVQMSKLENFNTHCSCVMSHDPT